MIDKELIDKVKRVQLWARHLANDALTGDYTSVFKGVGMEFDDLRKYLPGDDIKHIDWKVTARTREPHVKMYKEERDQTILLMVDVSGSQYFGLKGEREKISAAAELAALFAILATRTKDRVGLLLFSDHVEAHVPPASGRAHVFRIVRDVLTHKGRSGGTNIAAAVKEAMQSLARRSLVVLISDFQDAGYRASLSQLSARHDLVCAGVFDEAEKRPPKGQVGLGLYDPETGELIGDSYEVGPASGQDADSLNLSEADATRFAGALRSIGASGFLIDTRVDVSKPLISFLKEREARARS